MGWDDVVEHHLSELSLACFVLLLSVSPKWAAPQMGNRKEQGTQKMKSYVNRLILALVGFPKRSKSCPPFCILAIDAFLMGDEIGGISYRGRQGKATAEVVHKR
ncbi:hypothetical protein B0O80DRAFT_474895 [Mortierella sp. GBAus27b]|nr:hypothetical protein B0O80DRAFT_474895 [Mortierella sp. GBAus27b]